MFLAALRERTISKAICLEPAAGKTDFRNAARKKKKYLEKYFAKSVTHMRGGMPIWLWIGWSEDSLYSLIAWPAIENRVAVA